MFAQLASMLHDNSARRGVGIVARLRAAREAHFQRQALARLDESRLADIGLTRAQALAEATRAPWDVPAHWLR